MPPTEQSVTEQQVYINKTNIINLEKAVDEIKDAINKLANDYSHRITPAMTKFIGIMAGLLGVSVGVNATLFVLIIKLVNQVPV